MSICGTVVLGDDYSMGLSFDETAYSKDSNLSLACSEGDFIATNFTTGDEVTCYSPCPSENFDMCGTNGCLSQLDPPVCECVSYPWFPEGDPTETEQVDFPSIEPCKAKIENWVVVVVPVLAVLLLVGVFIYLRKRKKNYKIEEEKNDKISLNTTNDSDAENPSIQIQEEQAVQAAAIQNRAYVNDSADESTGSETVSTHSDQNSRMDRGDDDRNRNHNVTRQSQSSITDAETESETESEVSLRTKTKLVEREIRKVRKDIDFLKKCEDSSVTGTL